VCYAQAVDESDSNAPDFERKFWLIGHRGWMVAMAVVLITLVASFVYLLATSPYSRDSLVQAPFTTKFENGQVYLHKIYTPKFYSGWLPNAIGLYKQAVTIFWDRLTSPKIPQGDVQSIVDGIYKLRFDPAKPYLISGDQFDSLYPRNLSIFYQDLLNPHTYRDDADRHNRERISSTVTGVQLGITAAAETAGHYPHAH